MADCGFGLQADRLVGLAEMFAAFGVAELDDVEIAIPEHERRNLAGPGTLIGPVHVLRTHLNGGIGKQTLDLPHRSERRNDETLDSRVPPPSAARSASA